MNTKLLHVVTIGCQMNVYDSGQIRGVLFLAGYSETGTIENADLIIMNTCAIRQKAEQKAFSFLGRMSELKKRKPSLIIAVGGCVAQQYGADILKRMPFIDLVFGTDAIFRLSELVSRIKLLRCKIVDIGINNQKMGQRSFLLDGCDTGKVSVFVAVMRGCDNYCTYCVVPYVRGNEISRDPERIINEIESLVASGIKEIVLLGQNVNSYGMKDELNAFPELLKKINDIHGLERIRFTTSHPKDLSEDLMNAFCSLDKLCKHIHLPVQSGDNTILKRMNRGYTRELYVDKVAKLRDKCPGISVTSDFIVGFPGESNQQFESTLDLIEMMRFDSSFVFAYSDRPKATASKFKNKISEKIKKNRLHRLLKLQNSIAVEINRSMLGNVEKVLVEKSCCVRESGARSYNTERKPSLKSELENLHWLGRTSTNRTVGFKTGVDDIYEDLKGNVVNVRITGAKSHSLSGKKC